MNWMFGDVAKPKGGSSLAPVANSRMFSSVTTFRPLETLSHILQIWHIQFSHEPARWILPQKKIVSTRIEACELIIWQWQMV